MKAILEYDMDDQDDRMAHLRAVKSTEMAMVLSDIIYSLRRYSDGKSDDFKEGVDSVLDFVHDKMTEKGLNINDLIY